MRPQIRHMSMSVMIPRTANTGRTSGAFGAFSSPLLPPSGIFDHRRRVIATMAATVTVVRIMGGPCMINMSNAHLDRCSADALARLYCVRVQGDVRSDLECVAYRGEAFDRCVCLS